MVALKRVVVKSSSIVVELRKSYKLPWTKLEEKHRLPSARFAEEGDAPPADDPMAKIMDMMKMLYSKGGAGMQQDIEKAWLKAENKYRGK